MASIPSSLAEPPDSAAPRAWQRLILTFTAPARAFTGLDGRSWWLPYILIALVSLGFAATVGSKVGWDTVARNAIASSPKQQARIDQIPPAQQAQQITLVGHITRISAYVGFVLGPLLFALVIAAVLLGSFNFLLGGHAKLGSLYALYLYASLPQLLKLILVTLLLFSGVGTDTFQLNNPLGSNPAFYLQGSGLPHWALAVLTWFDVFLIWQLVLLALGCSILAKVSRGKAAAVVLGWTLLAMLGSAALA